MSGRVRRPCDTPGLTAARRADRRHKGKGAWRRLLFIKQTATREKTKLMGWGGAADITGASGEYLVTGGQTEVVWSGLPRQGYWRSAEPESLGAL